MKVIKPGVISKGLKFHTTCRDCNCEFEFYESEGQVDRDRDDAFVGINCPTCKKSIWLSFSVGVPG